MMTDSISYLPLLAQQQTSWSWNSYCYRSSYQCNHLLVWWNRYIEESLRRSPHRQQQSNPCPKYTSRWWISGFARSPSAWQKSTRSSLNSYISVCRWDAPNGCYCSISWNINICCNSACIHISTTCIYTSSTCTSKIEFLFHKQHCGLLCWNGNNKRILFVSVFIMIVRESSWNQLLVIVLLARSSYLRMAGPIQRLSAWRRNR